MTSANDRRVTVGAPMIAARWSLVTQTVLLTLAVSLPVWAMTPYDYFDKFGEIKSQVVLLVGLGALLVLFATGLQARTFRVTPSPALWVLGLLVLQTVASTLLSNDPVLGTMGNAVRHEGLLMVMANSVFFLTAYQVAASGRSRGPTWVARVLVAASIPVFLYAFVQMLGLDPIAWESFRGAGGRVFSSLGNPVFLGAYGLMVVLVGLALWLDSTRPAGLGWAVIAGAGTATVILTAARASWIGLACGLVSLVVLCWRARRFRRFLVGAALVSLLAVAIVVAGEVVPARSGGSVVVQSAATLVEPGSSRDAGRLAIWAIAGHMIADHPLLGVGPDEMAQEFEAYRTAAFNKAEGVAMVADKPHSSVLKWAVETGLPGVLMFAGLMLVILVPSGWRLLKTPPVSAHSWVRVGVWVAAAAYMVQSLVTVTAIGVDGVWWILLGFVAGDATVARASIHLQKASTHAWQKHFHRFSRVGLTIPGERRVREGSE